jgi:MOSC domain-containing protein YiiM
VNGRILQVNVSQGGIPKRAVALGVLEARGFHLDSWAHPQFHGGRNQAVLMIASEAIEELRVRGYPVFPGALGENLTTKDLDRRNWRTGQQYRVGSAVIELTKIRTPCNTLDTYGCDPRGVTIQRAIYDPTVKRGDFSSGLWAMSGFYARVLTEGQVRPGDSIVLESDLA